MNAVELISWDYKARVFWFTWWYGTHIGYFSPDTNVELDTGNNPTMSFRHAIVAAMKRFLVKHPEIRNA